MTIDEILKSRQAKADNGYWMIANGGTERPFISRSGKKLLYM